jgi:D-alanyl-lipoteichoic acid acyltransferase DltB (MBOAT superfamily)
MQSVFEGLMLFLWGLFKKLVLADRFAVIVNFAFSAAPGEVSGLQYAFAAAAFSVQLYCDFSAYSDMARGSARMLGIELMRNFNAPFLAVSIKDFWRRWHISLSTWFRDYLYFPLGGSRCARKRRVYMNLMVVFLISGLWHGAALTFVAWGFLHGAFQIVSDMTRPLREKLLAVLKIPGDNGVLLLFRRLTAFALVAAAFVFFRAESVTQGVYILKTIALTLFSGGLRTGITQMGVSAGYLVILLLAVTALLVVDALSRETDVIKKLSLGLVPKYAVYFLLLALIVVFGCYGAGYNPQEFIYFKF